MTGLLEEKSLRRVKESHDVEQSSLSEYGVEGGVTLISVVRRPKDSEIEERCDEHYTELGLPESVLDQFEYLRNEYYKNDGVDYPNDRAFSAVRVKDRYAKYLQENDEAWDRVEEIAQRVTNGEDITLVSFEPDDRDCHRHVLRDIIQRVVDHKSETKFRFVRD